jgi:hypothetical protein
MKRVTAYVLWTILFVAISATSFYCGGCVGFSQGYNFVLAKDAPYDAKNAVIALKKIKDNNIDEVKEFFENRLNGAIMRYWYHKQNAPVFYGIRFYDKSRWMDEESTKMITSACEYRKENPFQCDEAAQKKIETVLTHYLKE